MSEIQLYSGIGVVRVSSTDVDTDVALVQDDSNTPVISAAMSAVVHVAADPQHFDGQLAPKASGHLICSACDRSIVDAPYRHACSYFRE